MYIIGVNPSHNSTACLLKDGVILSCISEERLTGFKNETGLPLLSIKFLLNEHKLKAEQIDYLAISMKNPTAYIHLREQKEIYPKISIGGQIIKLMHPFLKKIVDNLMMYLPLLGKFYEYAYQLFYVPLFWPLLRKSIYQQLQDLGFNKKQIIFVDHHKAHAFSAYFNMPNYDKSPVLVFTADGVGDGICATVNIFSGSGWNQISKTRAGKSLAMLYGAITQYLGMKLNDHEYKVMGLAAYTKGEEVNKVYEKIKDLILVNKERLTFESPYHSDVYLTSNFLNKKLQKLRFDYIAGGVQKLVEIRGVEWIKAAIKKTKIRRLAFAGGLFMNVKLNKKIMELSEVNEVFFMPSAGDESTAIGIAQAIYWEKIQNLSKDPKVKPLENLYLGPEYDNLSIKKALSRLKAKKYRIKNYKNIEEKIAQLLSDGKIIARFAGRMEFGARALGNRSILANPSDLSVVRIINEQIKSRDFWMPFACTIIKEKEKKYLINPKRIAAPHMILAFDTTNAGQKELKAGIHQYDLSIRPQILQEDSNPGYYRIIKEFEKLTGIGGVLNTSFNLHGYPIVCTPEDAIYVFENSGLENLAIGNYLVQKKIYEN